MITSRMRMAAVAGSMALTVSLAAAPAVMAQDGPEATIESFVAAIAAKDFEALPSYFCEEQADQAAQFDMSELTEGMPEGMPVEMDVQALLDAFIIAIQLESIDVISQSDTEAIVHVVGSMAMEVDPEPLVPFIEGIIEMSGMEPDEATVNMFMGMMMSEIEIESEDIDTEITLVPGEEMAWLICSDLDLAGVDLGGGGEVDEDEMDEDESHEDDATSEEEMTSDED